MLVEILAGYFVVNTVAYIPRSKKMLKIWKKMNAELGQIAKKYEMNKREEAVGFTIARFKIMKTIAVDYLTYPPSYAFGYIVGYVKGRKARSRM
jgi:hypothetical protein